MQDLTEIKTFLGAETPDLWVENALENQTEMLIDHAHCEKKAATTALNLINRYPHDEDLLSKMSRLAREELRHFEQVIAIMKKRDIEYTQLTSSRYAGGMREGMRTLRLSGAARVARGETTIEEVMRVAPMLDA